MNLGHTFNTANASSFDEQSQNHEGLVERYPHFIQRALVIFGECLAALGAAESLKAVTMFTKAIAGYLAIVARHCGISLSSTTSLPDNEFAGSSRLRLWWILAPIGVTSADWGFAFHGKHNNACRINCPYACLKIFHYACIICVILLSMTGDSISSQERAAKGGEARAASLSSEQRKAIARKAADSRWGSDLPQASHDGPLQIGDAILVAAVLPNGKRLLAQGTFLKALGRSRTPKAGTGGLSTVDGLPFFLQAEILKQFISDELSLSTTPIFFRLRSGQRAVGYDALLLPMVCEVYLKLRDDLNAKVRGDDESAKKSAIASLKQYEHIIAACDVLVRGLAQRGIIALVDDATGYRADKTKEDVLRVIARYISPKLLPWTQHFPPELFEQIYRLHGWEYKPGSLKHPQYVGKLILKHIYEPLPPGVLEELQNKLPKNERGNRKAKLWQGLSDHTGIPHLDKQIAQVLTIMELSNDKEEFAHNFDRIFGKQLQLRVQVLKELPELTA